MDSGQVKLHEDFVQNLNGTNISEVLMRTIPFHLNTFLVIILGIAFEELSHTCSCTTTAACLLSSCKTLYERKFTIFEKEIYVIIIPLVLSFTVLANISPFLLLTISVVTIGIVLIIIKFTISDIDFKKLPTNFRLINNTQICEDKRSYVTCCRSLVNLIASIVILAVDFPVFPRRFAKTETFGFSLMDLGVGLFVLVNSYVVKEEKLVRINIGKTVSGSFVLFILGIFRYYLVQRINYQVHVSEYGVHWNFFITLALIRLLSIVILKTFKTSYQQPILIAGVLAIVHQLLLYFGIEEYVLSNAPRKGLIGANREGICSVLGYTSLYFIGIWANKRFCKHSTRIGDEIKNILLLFIFGVVCITFTVILHDVVPASRRLVNITYITWIMAMCFFHVAAAICIEIALICIFSKQKLKLYSCLTPVIFESINYNGLTYFLVSNLLTGLVNIVFNTLEMNSFQSIFILVAYMIFNCYIALFLYCRQIQFKYW